MPDMQELIAKLQRVTEGTLELDAEIWLAIGAIRPEKQAAWDAPIPLDEYARISCDAAWSRQPTRNLAAAARLVPKDERGGWFWRVGHGSQNAGWAHLNRLHPDHCDRSDEVTVNAPTPELALTIAALKARVARPVKASA